jgi:8-hydroxy-5-deazaflavin:NADPH oxidoreductase
MKFGTIGAGAVALAFGREALARGHEVVLSSRRGPDALGDKVAELGRGASAASVEEAASLDYVLLAVPWRNVESALKSLPAWNGRVLIDATNPFVETSPKLVLADLGGKGASEVVAALAQGARIVKAFNSIVTARFNEGPVKNGGRRVIFVSGDHPEPTAFIKQLIESFGFTAIDLGDLATGGRLQQAGVRSPVATSSNSAITNTGGADACSANQNFRRAGNRPRTCRPSRTSGTGRRRGADRCRARADQHE